MAKKSTTIKLSPIKVKSSTEDWCEYHLDDGSTLRLRPIITDVLKQEGQLSPNGDPIYQIKSGLIIEVVGKKSKTKAKKK